MANETAKIKKITFEDINNSRITTDTQVTDIEPLVWVGGSIYCSAGDVSFIAGVPKGGKSAVCGAIVASLFSKNINPIYLLNIEAVPASGKDVVYIDTEQNPRTTKKALFRILKKAGLRQDVTPPNLFIYNLRSFTKAQRLEALDLLFLKHKENSILWILDGLADFIPSVNDEELSNTLVEKIMHQSTIMNAGIICIMHKNPTGDKGMRGHLGSEADRKSGGVIEIKKDRAKKISWIECKMIREDKDFENVYFRFCDIQKEFILADEASAKYMNSELEGTKEERDKRKIRGVLGKCFSLNSSLMKKELYQSLCLHLDPIKPVSEKTADRWAKLAISYDLLINNQSIYTLNF